jgi:hypothetical protein
MCLLAITEIIYFQLQNPYHQIFHDEIHVYSRLPSIAPSLDI